MRRRPLHHSASQLEHPGTLVVLTSGLHEESRHSCLNVAAPRLTVRRRQREPCLEVWPCVATNLPKQFRNIDVCNMVVEGLIHLERAHASQTTLRLWRRNTRYQKD